MKRLNFLGTFALLTFMASPAMALPAPTELASGNVMNCRLQGGGVVQLNVDHGKTDFVLDAKARKELQPALASQVKDISGEATLADVRESEGYGHFFSMLEIEGELGTKSCQAWMRFDVEPGHSRDSEQLLAANSTIPLKKKADQNFVSCAGHLVRIESCTAGLDLQSMSELGHFFKTEQPD